MRVVISGVAVLAALCLMGASGLMNFLFWLGQGQTDREAHILGSVSVAFDIFKSLLPISIAWAWGQGRRVYVVIGSVLFLMFFGFGLMSALGFAAGNRGNVTAGRESLGIGFDTISAEFDNARARLKQLSRTRSPGVVEAELKVLEQDRFWQGSASCVTPSGTLAINFCKSVATKQAELAAAAEADKLTKRIADLSNQLQGLKSRGAGGDKDPQAGMIANLSGIAPETAQKVLTVSFAFLVELGAAFGLFLATGHSFNEFRAPLSSRKPEKSRELRQKLEAVTIEADPVPAPRRLPPAPLRLKRLDDGSLVVDDGFDNGAGITAKHTEDRDDKESGAP